MDGDAGFARRSAMYESNRWRSVNTEDEIRELYFVNLVKDFARHVPDQGWGNKVFADFGCGVPSYGLQYRRLFAHGYGIDIQDLSEYYADTDKFEFRLSDGVTVPLETNSMDYVFSHSALEHVSDIKQSLGEIHRILKIQGIAYLTVSPLYYSASGGHCGVTSWEHLDPSSRLYCDHKAGTEHMPHNLNRLTTSQLLQAIGERGWEVIWFGTRLAFYDQPRPTFIAPEISDHDVYTREFRLIVRKDFPIPGR